MSDGFYLFRALAGGPPKRGDLLQTAVGTKKERTWFIWFVRATRDPVRWKILRVRWWQIDPPTRIRLWRSAERHGGQVVWYQEQSITPRLRKKLQEIL